MIRNAQCFILLVLVGMMADRALAQPRQVDEVTRQLFEQYIARRGKIGTQSVMAATHLVAERGRENGFWKTVLAELQRADPHNEVGCVRVLGKMLEIDAAGRDVIRRREETGEISAWAATVCLGPEVVEELIKRGRKADRHVADHYVIALARARTPDAIDFFQDVIKAPAAQPDPFSNAAPKTKDASTTTNLPSVPDSGTLPKSFHHLESTRFHAAVGLAQLGDAEGIQWLIAHCEEEGTVMNAWPKGAPLGGGLSACCIEALRHLSGERGLSHKSEWIAWSKTVEESSPLKPVVFGDP